MIEKECIEKRIRVLEANVEKVRVNIENSVRMRISMQGGIIELKKLLDNKEKLEKVNG